MRRFVCAGILTTLGVLCFADFADAQLFRRGRAYNSGYFGPGYYDGNYGAGYYGNNGYYYGNNGSGWNTGNNQYGNNGYSRSYYQPIYDDGDQFNQQNNRYNDGRGSGGQDQAFIMVRVPAPDAQVWFDDHRTQQGGMQRFFESPPLQSGNYSYEIRAKWRQNGKDMDQTRTVRIHRGERLTVDFTRSGTRQGEPLNPPRRGSDANDSNRNQSNQGNQSPQNNGQNQPRQNQNPPQQDQ